MAFFGPMALHYQIRTIKSIKFSLLLLAAIPLPLVFISLVTQKMMPILSEAAGSIQLELYKCAKTDLSGRYGDDTAGNIAAAITNYVCRFGYVNPIHEEDKDLLALCELERPNVLRTFGDTFRMNATGSLILLGAAWAVDLDKYKDHMLVLAREGFAMVGSDTPDVGGDIPEDDSVYMYETASIGRTHL